MAIILFQLVILRGKTLVAEEYPVMPYMWNLKESNSEEQRVEWQLPGAGGGGRGEDSAGSDMELHWSQGRNFQF